MNVHHFNPDGSYKGSKIGVTLYDENHRVNMEGVTATITSLRDLARFRSVLTESLEKCIEALSKISR